MAMYKCFTDRSSWVLDNSLSSLTTESVGPSDCSRLFASPGLLPRPCLVPRLFNPFLLVLLPHPKLEGQVESHEEEAEQEEG